MPVAGGRVVRQAADRLDGGVRRGEGGGEAARLDDGRTALLHRLDEVALQPRVVGDDLRGGASADAGVEEIGELRVRVVAPDRGVRDLAPRHAGLLGELRLGAVLVEPHHGEPAVGGHRGGVPHGDEAVRVAGVADDEDAHVGGGVLLDGAALADEDLAVDAEEFLAFHPGLAGHAADEQGPVHAGEAAVQITGDLDALEQRERAVLKFHRHTLQGGQRRLDLDQLENDRLVLAEHLAAGETGENGVTDLAGCAGHRDTNGFFHHR